MSASRNIRAATNVAALLLCGILAGVLVAAAAFPALGMSGLTAKTASDSFQNLPTDLKTPPLPQKSVLLASDGSLITSFYDENREPTTLKDVPKVMQHAMVAAEDSRFYQHKGVDVKGVVRALVANQSAGQVTQGASTLTQQYVKNILKYGAKNKKERDAAEAQTSARKIKEMRLALALEKKYNKDEILDRYLNIAYFGNRGYGIGSAAKVYFSKPAKNLTLAESAFLAGMVRSPTETNPLAGPVAEKKAVDRRNYVLKRMVDLGFISAADAAKAKNERLKLHPNNTPGNCHTGVREYGFYCDWFLRWWKTQPAFGKTPSQREDDLRKGGYRITTALDPIVQHAAQASVDKQIPNTNSAAIGTVFVEPGTGYVKAMAINRVFGKSTKQKPGVNYPMTTNPLLTGSKASPGVQAGSTFKMFTMAAAIEKNIPLNITIDSPNEYVTTYPGTGRCAPYYCPHNGAARMAGVHTMFSAFGESVNTFFVQLEEMASVKSTVEMAERLGVVFRLHRKDSKNLNEGEDAKANGELAFTLGSAQVSPLDMATAYATLAARGNRCDPSPVMKVLNRDGKEVKDVGKPQCRQVIKPDVADAVNAAARCPVGDPTVGRCTANSGITAREVGEYVDRPVAGKSGTTNDSAAVWFVGYTPNMAGAVFVVNPDSPTENVNEYHRASKWVFTDTLNVAVKSLPVQDFVRPTSYRLYGDRVRVPSVAGMSVNEAKRTLRNAGFNVRVDKREIASSVAEGRVAKTSPGGGSWGVRSGYVAIYVSDGSQVVVPPSPGPPPAPGSGPPKPPGTGLPKTPKPPGGHLPKLPKPPFDALGQPAN